ncbi:hypothetical protein BSL78_23814 [Apostichopus japonicus]|uniref:Uncharacterized protein n=1 Tax=Stichopus japonicus TaxID=307972 RepID=A0A2G8JUF5_STIJA|nr:hypothetical protein BSL78_23814 [Apostichopus japonicus]
MQHTLKSNDNSLKQRAAQMWCLLRVVPLLIGEYIPRGNCFWELILKLRKITDIICAPKVTRGQCVYLKSLIEDHHSHFKRVFPDVSFIPKHHFLVHYPFLMLQVGPVVHMWCMRFEAKHMYAQRLSGVICCFKDICKTVTQRHQISHCGKWFLSSNDNAEASLCVANVTPCQVCDICGFETLLQNVAGLSAEDELDVADHIVYFGTMYRAGMVVVIDTVNESPIFCRIISILLVGQLVYIHGEVWEACYFDEHLHSYSVQKESEIDSDDNQDEESSCETSIACSTGTQSTSLDLLSMLDTHPKGEEITREYMKNKTLTPQTRITLVNIVCAALVKIHGYYPSPEEKERAARCIIDRFPNLRDKMGKSGHEHFFCKTGGQSGYIQSRLKNIRRHLPKQNQQRPRLGMSGAQYQLTNMENDKEQSTGDLPTIDNDEAKGLADFCRSTPLESKAAILKAMKEFTGNRVNWIKEKSPTMTQIIKEYPQYIEIPEIISQDFQQMFGEETGANFLMKWGQHAKSILEYMKNSRNAKLVELTKEYEGTAKSDELCALYALLGLVHLLPSFNTRKKGKCSREDHNGFFLDFQNIGTSVEDYIRSQQLQTTTRKQPYILALGSRYNVDQYFIAVDGTPIPVSRMPVGLQLPQTYCLKYTSCSTSTLLYSYKTFAYIYR